MGDGRSTLPTLMRSSIAGAAAFVALCGLQVADASPQAERATSGGAACRKVRSPLPRVERLRPPPQTVSRRDRFVAVVKTNCGRFEIKLDARRFPVIVNSFVYLARSGFYDGLRFNRVVPNFVIEGGDPKGNGTTGPGYHVTEPPPPGFRYRAGTVAMGKTYAEPRGRAGSNFFVVVGGGRSIAPDYAVLGRVRAGMATVRKIAALGTPSERPSQVVRIEWIRVHRE
jgi:peptidyl-prolyl cis-trans isomerase B (cyclophilin B)